MLVGPGKWILLVIVLMLLVSYRRLPDISRSIGRSMRIFRGELRGLGEHDVRTRSAAATRRGPLGAPSRPDPSSTASTPTTRRDDDD